MEWRKPPNEVVKTTKWYVVAQATERSGESYVRSGENYEVRSGASYRTKWRKATKWRLRGLETEKKLFYFFVQKAVV